MTVPLLELEVAALLPDEPPMVEEVPPAPVPASTVGPASAGEVPVDPELPEEEALVDPALLDAELDPLELADAEVPPELPDALAAELEALEAPALEVLKVDAEAELVAVVEDALGG